jgi:hypothetical protein
MSVNGGTMLILQETLTAELKAAENRRRRQKLLKN